MWIDACCARITLALARVLIRRRGWAPLGEPVILHILASKDARLPGVVLRGRIRSTVPDQDGPTSKALIELETALAFNGHYRRDRIEVIMTAPKLRWHAVERLVVAACRVSIIDCDVPSHECPDRVIADASMRLEHR